MRLLDYLPNEAAFIRVTEVVFIRVILSAIYELTLFNENQAEFGRLKRRLTTEISFELYLEKSRSSLHAS